MRPSLALAGMAALALSAPAPAQKRDWSAQAVATPAGGHLVGNSAARTKIVEWASYTCPHCAHFAAEAKAPLATMLRSGATSIEYRHMIRDPLDLAAVIVARCGGPRRFQRLNAAIYAGQDVWLPRGAEFAQTNRETLAKAEPGAQLRGLAEGSGLLAIGRANGLTDVALMACFADRAAIDRLVAHSRSVPAQVTGTPSFFVNGRYTGVHDWARLQPLLVP